jgi:hypothetical protein
MHIISAGCYQGWSGSCWFYYPDILRRKVNKTLNSCSVFYRIRYCESLSLDSQSPGVYHLTRFTILCRISTHVVAPLTHVSACSQPFRVLAVRTLLHSVLAPANRPVNREALSRKTSVGGGQRCLSDLNWTLTPPHLTKQGRSLTRFRAVWWVAARAMSAVQRNQQLLKRLSWSRVRVPPSNV